MNTKGHNTTTIRVKAFRRLLTVAELYKQGKVNSAEDIADRLYIEIRTAYDYWNTLKELEKRLCDLEG